MNSVPNVVYMQEFFLPHYKDKKMQDKRDYYSSNKYSDYLKYIATGIKDLQKLDFIEYSNNNSKSSGIFNQNGKMESEDIAKVRKDLRKTKSVIWSGVISFEEKFGKKWCANFEQAYNLVKSELSKYFKRAGLNPNNIEWFAGLHENTDNRHIHIVFFEKQPLRIRGNEKGFSRGRISSKAMDEFKANIELSATDYKAREIKLRTDLTKSFKEEINGISGLKLKNMLISLANQIPQNKPTFYNSESMQNLKSQIDNISNYIIKHNSNISLYKQDFDKLVKEKDELVNNYCRRNGYDKPIQSVGDKMMNDVYRRLGNIVIESAKNLKLKENERLRLNAKNLVEKRIQKTKLMKELDECLYLNSKVEYETIKAFQDYMNTLEEMRIKTLIEQGYLSSDFEM